MEVLWWMALGGLQMHMNWVTGSHGDRTDKHLEAAVCSVCQPSSFPLLPCVCVCFARSLPLRQKNDSSLQNLNGIYLSVIQTSRCIRKLRWCFFLNLISTIAFQSGTFWDYVFTCNLHNQSRGQYSHWKWQKSLILLFRPWFWPCGSDYHHRCSWRCLQLPLCCQSQFWVHVTLQRQCELGEMYQICFNSSHTSC